MQYKVIFHVDELAKWNLVLSNLSNLVNALKVGDFQVDVLANSEAVRYYESQDSHQDFFKMEKLAQTGVRFVACNNSLRAQKLNPDDLFNFVEIVPVGVLELIEKQQLGFAYIRP